jgi:hypothetical protein
MLAHTMADVRSGKLDPCFDRNRYGLPLNTELMDVHELQTTHWINNDALVHYTLKQIIWLRCHLVKSDQGLPPNLAGLAEPLLDEATPADSTSCSVDWLVLAESCLTHSFRQLRGQESPALTAEKGPSWHHFFNRPTWHPLLLSRTAITRN